jgi:hypothetical protein
MNMKKMNSWMMSNYMNMTMRMNCYRNMTMKMRMNNYMNMKMKYYPQNYYTKRKMNCCMNRKRKNY